MGDSNGQEWTRERVDAEEHPVEASVRVCLRGDLVAEVERLEQQLREDRRADDRENRTPLAPQTAQRILDLQDQARASEVEFTFRALGRRAYSDLLAAHAPTDEQQQEAAGHGISLDWNPETFPPALAAASCSAPADMAGQDAWWRAKYDAWSVGQWTKAWRTIIAVNAGVVEVGPKSVTASAALAAYEQSSTTAAPAASPAPSSSAG
jgi:hypothetical protein